MRTYNVVIVASAQAMWRKYYNDIAEHCGIDPAKNTQADFKATVLDLMRTAGSRPLYYEEPIAAAMGYHRVNFVGGHKYFMLYRVVGNEAVIEYIAHHKRSVLRMLTGKRPLKPKGK